jgi:hypothetical protein
MIELRNLESRRVSLTSIPCRDRRMVELLQASSIARRCHYALEEFLGGSSRVDEVDWRAYT